MQRIHLFSAIIVLMLFAVLFIKVQLEWPDEKKQNKAEKLHFAPTLVHAKTYTDISSVTQFASYDISLHIQAN